MFLIVNRRFSPKGLVGAIRFYGQKSTSKASKSDTNQPPITGDVQGLSEKCVSVPTSPVGPGAAKDKEYKNPEYFCYHVHSFAEAEIEMAKYRLPAPSNKRKFIPQ